MHPVLTPYIMLMTGISKIIDLLAFVYAFFNERQTILGYDRSVLISLDD